MAPSVTEGPRTAEFLLTEANGWRSREKVTLTIGANTVLKPGQVVEAAAAKFVTLATTNNAAGILYGEVRNATGSSADFPAVLIVRDAEIRTSSLIGVGTETPPGAGALTALRALGLILRP